MEETEQTIPEVAQTKQFRKELDEVLGRLKVASSRDENSPALTRPSRERSLAVTKLQEAIMWLGMDLKAMREEGLTNQVSPYPESYNPDSPVVEPTADGLRL